MLVEHLHEMRNEERAISMEFEALLEVMEQTELLESALEEFGYSQQISRIFNLDKIGSSLGFETDLDTSELPLVVDDPTEDENTQGALVALHAAMEKISSSGVKKATDSVSANEERIEKLSFLEKVIREYMVIFESGSFNPDKLEKQRITLADYNKMHTVLKKAMNRITTSKHHARILKLNQLNAWFSDLDKHTNDYNKLVDEYVSWSKGVFKIDPATTKMTIQDVTKHVNDEYYKSLIDNMNETSLKDSTWFKNYKSVFKTTVDISKYMLRDSDIWKADKKMYSNVFGFWRANRIKTKYSSKFKQPLSWLLRMATIDLVYYNNQLGVCLSYTYGCTWPLITAMAACHTRDDSKK